MKKFTIKSETCLSKKAYRAALAPNWWAYYDHEGERYFLNIGKQPACENLEYYVQLEHHIPDNTQIKIGATGTSAVTSLASLEVEE